MDKTNAKSGAEKPAKEDRSFLKKYKYSKNTVKFHFNHVWYDMRTITEAQCEYVATHKGTKVIQKK